MGSLGHTYKSYNLSSPFRAKALLDCARGMNFLHLSNLLHRDLKPDNIWYLQSPFSQFLRGCLHL